MPRKPPNPVPAEAADRLLADLEPLGNITKKSMFGGYGLFAEPGMFAIVDTTGSAYLRADETTSPDYERLGSAKHGAMPYWRIPPPVREDESQLLTWARTAIDVAGKAKRTRPKT